MNNLVIPNTNKLDYRVIPNTIKLEIHFQQLMCYLTHKNWIGPIVIPNTM